MDNYNNQYTQPLNQGTSSASASQKIPQRPAGHPVPNQPGNQQVASHWQSPQWNQQRAVNPNPQWTQMPGQPMNQAQSNQSAHQQMAQRPAVQTTKQHHPAQFVAAHSPTTSSIPEQPSVIPPIPTSQPTAPTQDLPNDNFNNRLQDLLSDGFDNQEHDLTKKTENTNNEDSLINSLSQVTNSTIEVTSNFKTFSSNETPELLKMMTIERKKGKDIKIEKERHKIAGRNITSDDIERIENGFEVPRYKVNPAFGLTDEIVNRRCYDGLASDNNINVIRHDFKVILENTLTIYNIIIFAAAIIFFILNIWIVFALALTAFANIAVDIYQTTKTKSIMGAMNLFCTSKVTVLREGTEKKVSLLGVVLDDIAIINPGDRLLLDAIVVEGLIEVYETKFPSESKIIKVSKGEMFNAGALVVSGKAKVQIENVDTKGIMEKIYSQITGNEQKTWLFLLTITKIFLKIIAVIIILFTIMIFMM